MKPVFRAALLLGALSILPGCAWVVIGGTGAVIAFLSTPAEEPSQTPPTVFVTLLTATVSGDVDVEYTVSDAERDPATVEVSWSLDGAVFQAASPVTGISTSGLATSPAGEVHHFLWDSLADLGTTPQGTVWVRISPSDAHGAGTPRDMGPFAVDNNGIPVASAVTPAAPLAEDVTIDYVLADSEGNAVGVTVEWRAGGTGAFQACFPGAGGDGTSGLATSAGGTAHVFVWASEQDTTCTDVSGVEIRITPRDTKQGSSGTSAPFDVLNNDPPAIQSITLPAGDVTGTATIEYVISDSHSDVSRVEVEWKRESEPAWPEPGRAATPDASDPAFVTDNRATTATGVNHVYPWNSDALTDLPGEDVQVRVRIRASDDGGATWGAWTDSAAAFWIRNDSAPYAEIGDTPLAQNGLVFIPYRCFDDEADSVSILGEYRLHGSSVWRFATSGKGSSSGFPALAPGGTEGIFVWDTRKDQVRGRQAVFRITPSQANVVGFGATTSLAVGNTGANQWRFMPSLPTGRDNLAAVAWGNKLYAFGGMGGGSGAETAVEEFDLATGAWNDPVNDPRTPMPTPRYAHACVAFGGKIYLFGGWWSTSTVAAVEAYDPVSDTWDTSLASMPTPRSGLKCAVIGDRIYAVSGQTQSGRTGVVEVYEPATDTWLPGPFAAMPGGGRSDFGCALAGGNLYVAGGFDGAGPTNGVLRYDPAADAWSAKTAMPTSRSGLACETMYGKIYAMGGRQWGLPFTTVEIYDPAADSWVAGPGLQVARCWLTSALCAEKIYTLAGWDNTNGRVGTSEVFDDPPTATWTTRAPMATARSVFACSATGGKVFVFGGRNSTLGNQLSSVEGYDPATNGWTTMTPMPGARRELASAAVGGKIYVVGGYNGSSYVGLVEAYDPAANAWDPGPLAAMPTGRAGHTVAAVGGKLYALGGYFFSGTTNYVAALEVYDPGSDSWSTLSPFPRPRYSLSCAAVKGKIYVTGGYYPGTPAELYLDLYDTAADTWTAGADMPSPRRGHACAAVNGKIYVAAGTPDGSVSLASIEVYDPDTDTWNDPRTNPLPNLPTGRMIVGGTALDGVFYVAGGYIPSTYQNKLEAYSAIQNLPFLIPREPLPTGVSEGGLAAVSGSLFRIGGRVAASAGTAETEETQFVKDIPSSGPFEIRTPWSAKTAMSAARRAPGTAEHNGLVYAVGGFNPAGAALNTVERYDPSADGWTLLGSLMPTARGGLGLVRAGDRLFAIGGDAGGGAKVSVLQVYDLGSETWLPGPFSSMAVARSHFGCGVEPGSGMIYVFAGEGTGGACLNSVERYDPAADAWVTMTAVLPAGLKGPLCLWESGTFKLFGGELSSASMTRKILVYDHQRDAWKTSTLELPYGARDMIGCSVEETWNQRGIAQSDEFCFLGGGFDGTAYREGFFRFYTR